MANRWWAGHLGVAGAEPASSDSPKNHMAPPKLNSAEPTSIADDDEDRDNGSDEPKEGAVDVGNRRPRGRPPGSKNKPKPPIFVTRDSPNALRSYVMEVAAGADVAESITHFARHRQRGVCVLSGAGAVANVTLRQPAALGSVVPFEDLGVDGEEKGMEEGWGWRWRRERRRSGREREERERAKGREEGREERERRRR